MHPGLSKSDTIARSSRMGSVYIVYVPQLFLCLLTKSTTSAMKSVLHILFSQCLSRGMLTKVPILQMKCSTLL
ncbi:uncharacterized protein BJ212DRAFT_1384581 [Suillus subaureus]|uniref:Uncharacterized protein n=1 Tax=Suillus subaureus TaxID=48587 RepID=A0A9P7AK11_9AGAM|nr:uncharacterized protein BJ212DRAFT_1420079 [Suillus subaureus]XP_041188342.1 uncharacterized protein BJ212DRAFT_1384581 [Suillus subaureus]KAG1791009.1 hypothetical protein BJ212DRAFT_1420079 [Suillus subaureus]KAG1807957.1 hypothetical protein BJ212DRAFT_1384581 [Suillus subaureus]